MSEDSKTHALPAKGGGGLLGRLFGHGDHESSEPKAQAGQSGKTALDLADIQGFIMRGYRMPMVRHFLLTVGDPASARKLLGRLVSGDESDGSADHHRRRLACGVRTGAGRQSR